jgi:RES domain
VSERDVARRVLSTLSVPQDVGLADCTESSALAFGVTAAIHSSESYERTQEWAAAFAGAGFGGIRYLVSHDPAQRLVGVALFGPADAQDGPVADTGPIESDVITSARERFGILVLPTPA